MPKSWASLRCVRPRFFRIVFRPTARTSLSLLNALLPVDEWLKHPSYGLSPQKAKLRGEPCAALLALRHRRWLVTMPVKIDSYLLADLPGAVRVFPIMAP